MDHEFTTAAAYHPRIVEDRMMSAYRAAAQAGREAKEDARHRREVLAGRRKLAAAQQPRMPAKTARPASEPLALPNGRRVPLWERRKERTKEDIQFFAGRRDDIREQVSLRLAKGFIQRDEIELSGQTIVGVREEGLRSIEYAGVSYKTLERFPSLVPRQSRLRTSDGNAALRKSKAKILSLDDPYVEGNRNMLGFLRIDTDRIWPSVEAAVSAFRQVAADDRVACPPNILVGLVDEQGRYLSPHAIWLLPFGEAVLNMPKVKGFRPGTVNIFKAVYYGLIEAHLELGADAEAPATTQQTKNPLSPFWTTVVVNDDICPSLSQHAEYLDLTATKEKLGRRQAQIQSALPLAVSNGLYNAFRAAAFSYLGQLHFGGDGAYRDALRDGCRGALAERLFDHLNGLELGAAGRDKRGRRIGDEQRMNVAAIVSDAAAHAWDPSRLDGRVARGTLMHEVEGLETLAERQAVGAEHARARLMDATDERISDAVSLMMTEGTPVTRKGLARVSGCSINTVRSRWSMVEQLIEEGSIKCIVKKRPASSSFSNPPLPVPLPDIPVARTVPVGAVPHWILDPDWDPATNALHDPHDEHFTDEGYTPDPDAPEDQAEDAR